MTGIVRDHPLWSISHMPSVTRSQYPVKDGEVSSTHNWHDRQCERSPTVSYITVQWTVHCSVLYTAVQCSVHFIAVQCSVQCIAVQCSVHSVQCTVYSVHSALDSAVQCIAQCTPVQCSVQFSAVCSLCVGTVQKVRLGQGQILG